MRGKLWCLNWRSWATWDTTRTLSIFWEPAPMEVRSILCYAGSNIVNPCLWKFSAIHLIGNLKELCGESQQHTCVFSSGPVLVITEYCSLGDLLNFLRQKAETFVNFVMNMPDIVENSNDYKNICNQKHFIRRYIIKNVHLWKTYNLCFRILLTSSVFFFSSNSDSGISSTSLSSYLEMRPSQLPNIESSQGKKLPLQVPVEMNTKSVIRHTAAARQWKV